MTQSAETTKARLDQCMASWDRDTHITQSNWRQLCVSKSKQTNREGIPNKVDTYRGNAL
jgi:hypothetical protein